jgi:trans-aconitate methyltransferase
MEAADRVTDAYDRIAPMWRADRLGAREPFRERALVDRLVAPLPPGARILDVGCGCGEPVAADLASRGFAVTGLDGAARMLDLARRAVPAATFLLGDLRVAHPGGPFHAVVAWDVVFHLPRADHPAVFARFRSWLRPGGRLLLSLGGSGEEGFTSRMHGETFFYSAHEPAVALGQLERAGLRVEDWEVDEPSSRGHVAVLAVHEPA